MAQRKSVWLKVEHRIKREGPMFPVRSLRNFRNPVHHQQGYRKCNQKTKLCYRSWIFMISAAHHRNTLCSGIFWPFAAYLIANVNRLQSVKHLCTTPCFPQTAIMLNSEENDTGGTICFYCAVLIQKTIWNNSMAKTLKRVSLIMTTKDQMQVYAIPTGSTGFWPFSTREWSKRTSVLFKQCLTESQGWVIKQVFEGMCY